MGLVCLSLYIPEVMHTMDNNTKASMDSSASRSFILLCLCGYLNSSLAGKLEKEAVWIFFSFEGDWINTDQKARKLVAGWLAILDLGFIFNPLFSTVSIFVSRLVKN